MLHVLHNNNPRGGCHLATGCLAMVPGILMLCSLKLALAGEAKTEVVTAVPGDGFEGCRCVAPEDPLPPLLPSEVAEAMLEAKLPGGNLTSYGVGCRAHDSAIWPQCQPTRGEISPLCSLNLSPVPKACTFAGWEQPAWCQASWCYVADPDSCEVNHWPSEVFAGSRSYSFAACGHQDMFTGEGAMPKILEGKVLRAGIVHNSGSYVGAFHPLGNTYPIQKDEQWHGPQIDLMHMAAEEGGYFINYTDVPQWVTNQSGYASTFTNCVYAVGLGYLDLCVGDFTVTPGRVSMAKFVSIKMLMLYLAVPHQQGVSLSESILRVFKPFEPQVWGLVVLILVAVSSLMVLQESFYKYSRNERARVWPKRGEAGQNILIGLRSFTDKRVLHETISWGARVTSLGLGMFLLLTIAMYSANLVNILVADSSSTAYKDLEEAVESQAVICTHHIYAGEVARNYPGIILLKDSETGSPGLLTWDDVRDAMAAGLCDASVLSPSMITVMHSEGQFCSWDTVSYAVLKIFTGFPLGSDPELAGVQHAYQTLLDQGVWAPLAESYKPSSICPADVQTDISSLSFKVVDFGGVLVVLLTLVGLGVLFSIIDFPRQRRQTKLKAVGEPNAAPCQVQDEQQTDEYHLQDGMCTASLQVSESNTKPAPSNAESADMSDQPRSDP